MFKKIDRRYLSLVLPTLILLFLLANSYFIVLFGEEITLKTVPFDPTDLFRGDYVELSYEIEVVKESQIKNYEINNKSDYGQRTDMYAVLKDDGDVYILDYITKDRPDGGIYLRCEVYAYYGFRGDNNLVEVDYRINRYFIKEKTGTELEEAARKGQLLGKVKVYKGRGILVGIVKEN